MLIDYLRYQAYLGKLRSFFEEGWMNYSDPRHTTGQHLRFRLDRVNLRKMSPYFLYRQRMFDHAVFPGDHWPEFEDAPWAIDLFDFGRGLRAGARAPTFKRQYREEDFPSLEIVLDVNPENWTGRYEESQSFEGVRIAFRRSPVARAHATSAAWIKDEARGPENHGTLCVIFEEENNKQFGLTCGHVLELNNSVVTKARRRFLGVNFGESYIDVGRTVFRALGGPPTLTSGKASSIDAALFDANVTDQISSNRINLSPCGVVPIDRLEQGDPVSFKGASRRAHVRARVVAVTVNKLLKLEEGGSIYSVGDVMMLGHRQPIYVIQPLSRRGDSGSAVMLGDGQFGASGGMDAWCGMIVGGEDAYSFATYSEVLLGWAMSKLNAKSIDVLTVQEP